MKQLITIITILTVMPVVTAIALISFGPQNFGGWAAVPSVITGMLFFGAFTLPIWLTYLPSLILTPIIMGKISKRDRFYLIPLGSFIFTSLTIGAVCGIIILSPFMIMSLSRSYIQSFFALIWAGAVSGAVTFTIIALVYRKMGASKSRGSTSESQN